MILSLGHQPGAGGLLAASTAAKAAAHGRILRIESPA
jgi:hypothetical protein